MRRRGIYVAAGIGIALALAGQHHHGHHGLFDVLDSTAAAPAVGTHGKWGTFLEAIRSQESGGNYGENTSGCLGAYCWNAQSNWDADARACGLGQYAGTDPASLPPSVQTAVASRNLRVVYRQTGSLLAAAEWWNGGHPYSIPNPQLPAQPWAPQCGAGTSGAYACQVLARMGS